MGSSPIRTTRRSLWITLALLSSLATQHFFSKAGSISPDLSPLLGVASLFLSIIWVAVGFPAPSKDGRVPGFSIAHGRNLAFSIARILLLALAMIISIGGFLLYLNYDETWLIRLLWITSLLTGLIAFLPWKETSGTSNHKPLLFPWELVILLVITIIGFAMRFWHLDVIPNDIDGDVASFGLQVFEIIEKGIPNWFGVGWTGIPMLLFQSFALTTRWLGVSMTGVMAGSVFLGTACIPAIYAMGSELFGKKAGLIAAFLLAVSYTNIHSSRIMITEGANFCIILSTYLLFRAFHSGKMTWYFLSGSVLGLSLYSYYSIRILPILLALLFIWLLIWKRKAIQTNWQNWLAMLAGLWLAYAPMVAFTLKDLPEALGRTRDVTIFNPGIINHLMEKYQITQIGPLMIEQIKRSFLVFFHYGDSGSQFGYPGPIVNPLTAIFLVIGVAYCLFHIKDLRHFALISWLVVALIFGGVLTNDPPFWLHLAITLPVVMVLAGYALSLVMNTLYPYIGRTVKIVATGVIVAVLVFSGVQNWRSYLSFTQHNAYPRTMIARFIASIPSTPYVHMVSGDFHWIDREFQFIDRGITGDNLEVDSTSSKNPSLVKTPEVFILTTDRFSWLPELQKTYPQGVAQDHYTGSGDLVFKSLTIIPPGYPTTSKETTDNGLKSSYPIFLGSLVICGLFLLAFLVWIKLPQVIWPNRQETLHVGHPEIATVEINQSTYLDHHSISVGSFLRQLILPIPGSFLRSLKNFFTGFTMQSISMVSFLSGIQSAVIPALTVLMAYFAQGVLDAGRVEKPILGIHWLQAIPDLTRTGIGVVIYLLALILWMISITSRFTYDPIVPTTLLNKHSHAQPVGLFAKGWLLVFVVSILIYLVSTGLYIYSGETSTIRAGWMFGMGLFLVSQVMYSGDSELVNGNHNDSPGFRWFHWLSLVIVLATAFWLRFNRLTAIPDDFHGDMASYGLEARDVLLGNNPNFFTVGWADISRIGYLPTVASMALFGNNYFGLQMTAVVEGILSIIAIYLLVWRVFDSHRLALLCSAVMSINVVHIHFSRIAAYMDPWPFCYFALFFIVDGLKARRPASFGIAGVLLALGLQMYYSGRVTFFILAVFLIYAFFFQRSWISENELGWVVLVSGFLIGMGPTLVFDALHWDNFVARTREVIITNPDIIHHLEGKYQVKTFLEMVWVQIRLSVLMFNQTGDSSTQFGFSHPMFHSFISPLIIIGLGSAIRRWKEPGMILTLAWLALMMVLGGILTVDAPFWPRLVGIIPAASLLVALAIDQLIHLLERILGRIAIPLGVAAVVALLAITGYANWNMYYAAERNNAHPAAMVGRYLTTLPTDITACGVISDQPLTVRETYFLAWPRKVVDVNPDGPLDQLETCKGDALVWVVSQDNMLWMDRIRARWPGGLLDEHLSPSGYFVFATYLVGNTPSEAVFPRPVMP